MHIGKVKRGAVGKLVICTLPHGKLQAPLAPAFHLPGQEAPLEVWVAQPRGREGQAAQLSRRLSWPGAHHAGCCSCMRGPVCLATPPARQRPTGLRVQGVQGRAGPTAQLEGLPGSCGASIPKGPAGCSGHAPVPRDCTPCQPLPAGAHPGANEVSYLSEANGSASRARVAMEPPHPGPIITLGGAQQHRHPAAQATAPSGIRRPRPPLERGPGPCRSGIWGQIVPLEDPGQIVPGGAPLPWEPLQGDNLPPPWALAVPCSMHLAPCQMCACSMADRPPPARSTSRRRGVELPCTAMQCGVLAGWRHAGCRWGVAHERWGGGAGAPAGFPVSWQGLAPTHG